MKLLLKLNIVTLLLSTVITGCSDSARSTFVASCTSNKKGPVDQCECVYDLSKKSLAEEQHELFLATFLGDQKESAKLRSSMGIMQTAAAVGKIGWMLANATEACK